MIDLLSLGHLYPSDFLAPGETPRCAPTELRVVYDEDTSVVQLASQPPRDVLWGRYWYRSGVSDSMRWALADVVRGADRYVTPEPGDVWVDVACNDGTLLAQVPDGWVKVGVDPVEEAIRAEAERHADLVIPDYFTLDAWRDSRYGERQAKVVTCAAMLYDLPDPQPFLRDLRELLARDGLAVLQLSYTPLMLAQVAFDNVCHEHARYYTLLTLSRELYTAGLQVLDVELNDVNGGSFRVYAARSDADVGRLGSQPQRDVGQLRQRALAAHETREAANSPARWKTFRSRVETLRERTRACVTEAKERGLTVWAYGASTKGNTLLQYFGLDRTLIDGIAERSEAKYGLRTVGTDIPIYPEEAMREADPDYLLVLPWHFLSEFRRRESKYLAGGGRFIVPCPRFEVVGG